MKKIWFILILLFVFTNVNVNAKKENVIDLESDHYDEELRKAGNDLQKLRDVIAVYKIRYDIKDLKNGTKKNNDLNMALLGYCYEYGINIKRDYNKAIELYFKVIKGDIYNGINKRNAQVACRLGLLLLQEKDKTRAYERSQADGFWCIANAAENGSRLGQLILARIYSYKAYPCATLYVFNDDYIRTNFQRKWGNCGEAIKYYTMASDNGLAYIQIEFADYLVDAFSYDYNSMETAAYWYGKAADQGNAIAQYKLGICYYNGIGVNKNKEKAMELVHKAAEQGYKQAFEFLQAM